MNMRLIVPFVLVMAFASTVIATDSELQSHPGYFPLEELGIISADMTEIDINLKGSLLKMVSGATQNEDPELSTMMSKLEGIRVLAGEPGEDFANVAARLDDAAKNLEARGWQRIVRVRDDDERVHIFVLEDGDLIQGMTIFSVDDGDEVVLINIVGTMDPAQMGRLLSGIDGVSGVHGLNGVKLDVEVK